MVSLDTEATYKDDKGVPHYAKHLPIDGMMPNGKDHTEAVMMCFEITPGDEVAVANLNDECHKESAGKYATALSANCETETTVDDHAMFEPGIGTAKTMLVYDLNDPPAGKCYNSFESNMTNEDVLSNENVGKHRGTDCPEVCKVTAKDSEDGGHTSKTDLTAYLAGYLEWIGA